MTAGSIEPLSVEFPWQLPQVVQHTQRLLTSFQRLLGYPLLDRQGTPEELAHALFEAPFVVVSHGTEADPIFNYGNRQALKLWEFDWPTFTQLPSRLSAEPIVQEARDRVLAETQQKGYACHYRGIRISRTGVRFWIEDVILWNLHDEVGQPCGQAATFPYWRSIDAAKDPETDA